MTTEHPPSRTPRQLLLALLGDCVLEEPAAPVRTSLFIAALDGTGIAEPAIRGALDRMVRTGVLTRERAGREVLFRLTPDGERMLSEASVRVRASQPFHFDGAGWTLAAFSIPEGRRDLRHRLRAILTWEGFAPLRDGLWLAPGEIPLNAALRPLRADLPEGAILAFHAQELADFPIAASVRQAWDIAAIRARHEAFIAAWADTSPAHLPTSALAARVMLGADWLALLRADPGLPPAYMDADWPAPTSAAVHRRVLDGLLPASTAEFTALRAGRLVDV